MTSLSPFTADDDEAELSAVDQPGGALASLVDHLMEATAPVAFQVVFQRRESWQADADLRKEDVIDGRDTLAQEIIGSLFELDGQSENRDKTSLATRLQNASRQSRRKIRSGRSPRTSEQSGFHPGTTVAVNSMSGCNHLSRYSIRLTGRITRLTLNGCATAAFGQSRKNGTHERRCSGSWIVRSQPAVGRPVPISC